MARRAEGVAKLKKALGIYRELGKSERASALEEEVRRHNLQSAIIRR